MEQREQGKSGDFRFAAEFTVSASELDQAIVDVKYLLMLAQQVNISASKILLNLTQIKNNVTPPLVTKEGEKNATSN